jgi:hypothetical protein
MAAMAITNNKKGLLEFMVWRTDNWILRPFQAWVWIVHDSARRTIKATERPGKFSFPFRPPDFIIPNWSRMMTD